MTEPSDCGCPDYELSRRTFLRGTGVVAGAGAATIMVGDVLTSAVFGAERRGNVLVVLSQRGGADGLSMVVPHREDAYYLARPLVAIKKRELIHTDHTFGLHPAFAPLSGMWRQNRLTAIHAVGLPAPNRSHFEAMEEIEDADPGSRARIGWLNRVIGALDERPDILNGVHLGSNLLPTALVGPQPTVALTHPGSLATPYADLPIGQAVHRGLQQMHDGGNHPTRVAGRGALRLARRGGRFTDLAAEAPAHSAIYPASSLGTSLRHAAALIRAGLGVRAIAVDSGGWDHHVDLRNNVNATIGDMASSLGAFFTDLGPIGDRVTVVTLSEFGRRLAENGAAGVDHGYGNAVLVMGGGVRGGRYYARWPSLREDRQVEGDLAVTTDYRHVLAEILASRFPDVDTARVFPGAGFRKLGFMRRANTS